MPSPEEILQQYWGHSSFRPLQQEIIQSVLDGEDALALLPTGGGKSVCFQVPAMVKEGLCLVISPLIALMKDQVENLKKKNILALSIQSGMSYFEVRQALKNAAFGPYKFLYVSPERLETALFREFIPAFNLSLIAVDEAHCISQWGYDFRPPYLRIADIRADFPNVPILALTASATPLVQQDICDKLLFKTPRIFRQSFEKPNLSFSTFCADSKINKLLEILGGVNGSAVVYCRNRKRTKEIAHTLTINGISADFYHAGLPQSDRNKKQEAWIQNHTRVIVCTNAFGMGIDKPDVRSVIHMDIPDNLENYYQEAGRAGRDGQKAYAVLIFSKEELEAHKKSADQKYPAIADIRKVYQAVCNHLQIPSGGGQGQYYDFNINDFIRYFKLDTFLVIHALKALEQEGYLSFNEQVFMPSKIGFTCTKEDLQSIATSYHDLDILVKAMLRAYEGIFDNIVSIHENQLSRITKLPVDELKQLLNKLQGLGIVDYQPQKETPQLFMVEDRAQADHLIFDTKAYAKRKELYQQRLTAMEQYVTLEKKCRSQYIGNYFGDTGMKNCGICDNCLKTKRKELSAEEFTAISAHILQRVGASAIDIHTLLKQSSASKEKVWKVLDHLQAEGKISINDKGLIAIAT